MCISVVQGAAIFIYIAAPCTSHTGLFCGLHRYSFKLL
nr:MAG TPA: hypothetical protein [Bacteriophage sp.]